jgi:hypothetical protein
MQWCPAWLLMTLMWTPLSKGISTVVYYSLLATSCSAEHPTSLAWLTRARRSRSNSRIDSRPQGAAPDNGAILVLSTVLMAAPWSSNKVTTLSCIHLDVVSNGVQPLRYVALTWAPHSRRELTCTSSPFFAASRRGGWAKLADS